MGERLKYYSSGWKLRQREPQDILGWFVITQNDRPSLTNKKMHLADCEKEKASYDERTNPSTRSRA